MRKIELNKGIAIDDFIDYYRLKDVAVKFCKSETISDSGMRKITKQGL